jgi:hypothetical protein
LQRKAIEMMPLTEEKRAVSEISTIAKNLAQNCGYHVFPCGDDKKPAISKREGGNGFLDASRDPDTINRMFSRRNASLIGIATGIRSGFDVLDVDVKHDAARAWLIAAKGRIPTTRTYQTRSGGFHILFRHAEGVHNTESHIAKGIDTRGEGGYVIFWYGAGFPCTDHSPIADWPDWLLEALFYRPEPIPTRAQTFRSNGGNVRRFSDHYVSFCAVLLRAGQGPFLQTVIRLTHSK